MGGPRGRRVCQLFDRIDDLKPDRGTDLVNPPDGFRPTRVAVSSEDHVSGAPDVNIGDHAAEAKWGSRINF